MGRLGQTLVDCREQGRAALIVYLCAGDPTVELTAQLVCAAAEAGADIIELGMPFSDPTADGPVIQRASARALAAGMTLGKVFDVVREVRHRSDVPILLFGYYNPLLAYGESRAVETAKQAGADGFLVVDLPPEEAAPVAEACAQHDLDYVPPLAPTSTLAREQAAASVARGFVYYVSMTGITGGRVSDLESAAKRAKSLSGRLELPVAMGFGIKTAQDASVVGKHTDGVVVGSALVRVIEDNPQAPIDPLRSAVAALREGLG